jgi:imidazoleglycerol-phosphate dehydratase
MRSGEVKRRTNETDIAVRLVLDGTGKAEIATICSTCSPATP